MNEFHIGEQHAKNIYQAEHIHLNPAPADHARLGAEALALHDYPVARKYLAAAAEANPGDSRINYQYSLALLDGRRPHMHSAATVEQVQRRLGMVQKQLPEAMALLVLVAEDYQLTWKNNNTIPEALIELANSVSPQRAREVIDHVPAEQSRVWRLLALRARRDH